MDTQDKIEKLIEFRDRDNFATEIWNSRGLNPSDPEVCEKLRMLFTSASNSIIEGVRANSSRRRLKLILKNSLGRFNKWDYDTEEKEFICDLFYELSAIAEVDFRRNLNIWLYGVFLMTLYEIVRFFKPERVIHSQIQECINCRMDMQIQTLSVREDMDYKTWIIGRCSNCKEFNLLSNDLTGSHRYINYNPEEHLPKNEYTQEQALARLEQVKFFRK